MFVRQPWELILWPPRRARTSVGSLSLAFMFRELLAAIESRTVDGVSWCTMVTVS